MRISDWSSDVCSSDLGIHAYWITFLDPASAFDITLNVKLIIMAVFGGPATILGPIVGSFILTAVSQVLSSEVTRIAGLFFGVVLVVAVVLMRSYERRVGKEWVSTCRSRW